MTKYINPANINPKLHGTTAFPQQEKETAPQELLHAFIYRDFTESRSQIIRVQERRNLN